MKKLIYIADDDAITCGLLEHILTEEGYDTASFETGDALYEAFLQTPCNIIVMDVAMPGNDGFMIGIKIKQVSDIPIIMLTGMRTSDDDYAFGISLGFDAYFTKPINSVKLIAHIRALSIRQDLASATLPPVHSVRDEKNTNELLPDNAIPTVNTITYSDIVLHPDRFSAYANKKELQLTNIEFNLLKALLVNQNRAISRLELLDMVWGTNSYVGPRAADDIIKRLRRKLGSVKSNVEIGTVYGFGFRLSVLH